LLLASFGGAGSFCDGSGSSFGIIGGGATPICNVLRELEEGGPRSSDGGATPIGGRSVFVNVLCGCCCFFVGTIGFVDVPGEGAVFIRLCAAVETGCGFTAAIAGGVGFRAAGGSGGGAVLFVLVVGACDAFAGSGGGAVFGLFALGVAFCVAALEMMSGASTFVSDPGAFGITGCVLGASGT
jgi:hypothetical protein